MFTFSWLACSIWSWFRGGGSRVSVVPVALVSATAVKAADRMLSVLESTVFTRDPEVSEPVSGFSGSSSCCNWSGFRVGAGVKELGIFGSLEPLLMYPVPLILIFLPKAGSGFWTTPLLMYRFAEES